MTQIMQPVLMVLCRHIHPGRPRDATIQPDDLFVLIQRQGTITASTTEEGRIERMGTREGSVSAGFLELWESALAWVEAQGRSKEDPDSYNMKASEEARDVLNYHLSVSFFEGMVGRLVETNKIDPFEQVILNAANALQKTKDKNGLVKHWLTYCPDIKNPYKTFIAGAALLGRQAYRLWGNGIIWKEPVPIYYEQAASAAFEFAMRHPSSFMKPPVLPKSPGASVPPTSVQPTSVVEPKPPPPPPPSRPRFPVRGPVRDGGLHVTPRRPRGPAGETDPVAPVLVPPAPPPMLWEGHSDASGILPILERGDDPDATVRMDPAPEGADVPIARVSQVLFVPPRGNANKKPMDIRRDEQPIFEDGLGDPFFGQLPVGEWGAPSKPPVPSKLPELPPDLAVLPEEQPEPVQRPVQKDDRREQWLLMLAAALMALLFIGVAALFILASRGGS